MSDAAPAEDPRPDEGEDVADERPRRRGEIVSLSQLSSDEILAELDRRERRMRHLRNRQAALTAELAEIDAQLADVGARLAAAGAEREARQHGAGETDDAEDAAPRERRPRGPRARNEVSLADAIAAAVEIRARITPGEAAELVRSNGYVTNAQNFAMSVATALSKDARFVRIERGVYERIE